MSHLAAAARAMKGTSELARSTVSVCVGITGQLATLATRRAMGAVSRTSTSSKKTAPGPSMRRSSITRNILPPRWANFCRPSNQSPFFAQWARNSSLKPS